MELCEANESDVEERGCIVVLAEKDKEALRCFILCR